MCIICDNSELGDKYLSDIAYARHYLKECEKTLLHLSKIDNIKFQPTKEKAKAYGSAHKQLVKIRKSLNKVEEMRSGNYLKKSNILTTKIPVILDIANTFVFENKTSSAIQVEFVDAKIEINQEHLKNK